MRISYITCLECGKNLEHEDAVCDCQIPDPVPDFAALLAEAVNEERWSGTRSHCFEAAVLYAMERAPDGMAVREFLRALEQARAARSAGQEEGDE